MDWSSFHHKGRIVFSSGVVRFGQFRDNPHKPEQRQGRKYPKLSPPPLRAPRDLRNVVNVLQPAHYPLRYGHMSMDVKLGRDY
jgi:hypothetical protein